MSPAPARTYEVRTHGCQMNVHDSERLTGLLEEAGYVAAPGGDHADVVVFNTCAVRENADNKLYGNLGQLASVKKQRPGMQIAVGGCLAQKDRSTITQKAPWVDVVFGTHNIGSLPVLLERARVQEEAQVEILESLEVFPSTLPTRRESAYAAWVSISVGCNNTCTFCIVPALRGKEKDRRPGEILAEIEALVAEGVTEVTLLGQNVNAYGVEFGDRQAFSKLLRACGDIEGLERVRFTSPHPAEFTDDVIEAMARDAERDAVAAHAAAVRLRQGAQGHAALLPPARSSSASSSGSGPPSPTRRSPPTSSSASPARPRRTSRRRSTSSGRPGSPARSPSSTPSAPALPPPSLDDQVPKAVVQERYERLVAVADEVAWAENRALEGQTVELMVAEGEGRKDAATHRLSGRARDNRLVHFTPVSADGSPVDVRPGDMVEVVVSYGAPHHLVADGPVQSVRRTRAGDAWEGRTRTSADGRRAGPADDRRPRTARAAGRLRTLSLTRAEQGQPRALRCPRRRSSRPCRRPCPSPPAPRSRRGRAPPRPAPSGAGRRRPGAVLVVASTMSAGPPGPSSGGASISGSGFSPGSVLLRHSAGAAGRWLGHGLVGVGARLGRHGVGVGRHRVGVALAISAASAALGPAAGAGHRPGGSGRLGRLGRLGRV